MTKERQGVFTPILLPMSEALKAIREAKKFTQEKAAKASGIKLPTLKSWEQGAYEADMEGVAKLMAVYSVGMNEFLAEVADRLSAQVGQEEGLKELLEDWVRVPQDRRPLARRVLRQFGEP